jgi:HEAT repeat protein
MSRDADETKESASLYAWKFLMPDKPAQDATARRASADRAPQKPREESPFVPFLAKLFKAMRGAQFYPEKHPAFDVLVDKCYAELHPILEKYRELSFEIRNQCIHAGGRPVVPDGTETRTLAMECLHRRLKKFQIKLGVEKWELAGFLRMLISDPAVIQTAGGVEKVLFSKNIRNIWANEINYQDFLYGDHPDGHPGGAQGERPGEQPGDLAEELFGPEEGGEGADAVDAIEAAPLDLPAEATPRQEDLVKLLQALDDATDVSAYGDLADGLLDFARRANPPLEHEDVYRALRVLSMHVAGREDRDPQIVPRATSTLRTLAAPDVIVFLTSRLSKRSHTNASRLMRLFWQIGPASPPILIEQLAEEKLMRARRILSDTIAGFGDAATPLLLKSLGDGRWFVVRNTVGILGEIGNPESITALEPLSTHEDPRIAKEVLKALGKIGGAEARRILEHFLARGAHDLQVLAAFGLGVMRDHEAVRALVSMLPRRVVFTNLELQREVIKALSKIGSPAAIPALSRIFRRRSLFARRANEELRVIAAQALARLDTEETRALLASGVRFSNPRVAQICRAAAQERDGA